MGLEQRTVAELDELAEQHDVDDYPSSARKPAKVAALRAAGLDGQRAVIEGIVNTSRLDRGERADVELDESVLRRAAAGTIRIVSTSGQRETSTAPAGDEQQQDDEIEDDDDPAHTSDD